MPEIAIFRLFLRGDPRFDKLELVRSTVRHPVVWRADIRRTLAAITPVAFRAAVLRASDRATGRFAMTVLPFQGRGGYCALMFYTTDPAGDTGADALDRTSPVPGIEHGTIGLDVSIMFRFHGLSLAYGAFERR